MRKLNVYSEGPWLKLVSMLYANTLKALRYIEKHCRTEKTIWNYATGTPTPSQRSDTTLNQIMLSILTAEKHADMQVVKQPD